MFWFEALFLFVLLLFSASYSGANAQTAPSARIHRSAEATLADWKQVTDYDYCVSVRNGGHVRTYAASILEGSPFEQLVATDGIPVSPERLREESAAIPVERQRRGRESTEERDRRIAQYDKQFRRYLILLKEFTSAFQFEWTGTARIGEWHSDVFHVTPRAGYRPKGNETQVLTGMEGMLWMDQNSDRWIQAEAEVVRSVPIVGFIARVERGTRFLLEERPVSDKVWLLSHFEMHIKTRILFLFSRDSTEDYSYFNYMQRGTLVPEMCLPVLTDSGVRPVPEL